MYMYGVFVTDDIHNKLVVLFCAIDYECIIQKKKTEAQNVERVLSLAMNVNE